ncbi:O-methyltransferase [Planctomycetota bacterium]
MAREFRADDWESYRMVYGEPHRELEPPERETAIVAGALAVLVEAGALPHTDYDHAKFLAHRQAVAEHFEIPWTAITPRMQRLLYAVSAIIQPQHLIAAGCFCGNTFISNAGAAVGPGACYAAQACIGIEIKPDEAERAERNVRRIDPTGVARVIAADAIDVCRDFPKPIDLLYLDADGGKEVGKGIYLTILQAALDKLHPGSLILAHNSVNAAPRLQHYLDFVRDPAHFHDSVNIIFDREGLEVSVR